MTKRPELPTAADFMVQKVRTLTPDVPLDEAVRFLLENGLSNAPVVALDTEPPALIGFLSERDCLEHLANDAFYERSGSPVTVRQMMRRHPICVPPHADLFTLATVFYQQGFRHLPVVENTQLLGIISRRDILEAMHRYWKECEKSGESERFQPDLTEIANLRFIIR